MGGPDFSQLVQWLPLIYLGSGALLAVVVMVDCGNTGQDPVFWAIAILIFNLLAFIVYFMVARLEIGPTRKHTAITRHRDDELRDQYASRGDPDELATMGTMAPKLGGIPESHANLNFVDPTLEKLLDEGTCGCRE
ncbi:MAG: hypothetical protein NTY09_13520 [bacterium]|nr:hypothetical protein [bacterium]